MEFKNHALLCQLRHAGRELEERDGLSLADKWLIPSVARHAQRCERRGNQKPRCFRNNETTQLRLPIQSSCCASYAMDVVFNASRHIEHEDMGPSGALSATDIPKWIADISSFGGSTPPLIICTIDTVVLQVFYGHVVCMGPLLYFVNGAPDAFRSGPCLFWAYAASKAATHSQSHPLGCSPLH